MYLGATENIAKAIQEDLKMEVHAHLSVKQPFIQIQKNQLLPICKYLQQDNALFFDFLNCITCVDNGVEAGTMDMIYHITSIPYEHSVILKFTINRNDESVPSLNSLWRTANWHEREIFDLFGVHFTNHPDLRRILLPADWEGHPLRKDYQEQETYHGIQVKSKEM